MTNGEDYPIKFLTKRQTAERTGYSARRLMEKALNPGDDFPVPPFPATAMLFAIIRPPMR